MTDISVVIPVLNDYDVLVRLLAGLPARGGVELIIVDGGNDRRMDELVGTRPDATLLRGRPGRGAQMNVGAEASSGAWILFLHADCTPPPGWDAAIIGSPASIVGGWFSFALDSWEWQARVITRVVGWRVRLLGLPYGDQGIFVRREIFDRLGGFREWPLMEDVDLVRRLQRMGPVASLPLEMRSSARRWHRDGWLRRSGRNLSLLGLYFLGVPPARLARWY